MTHRQTILAHLLRGQTIDRDSALTIYGIKGLPSVITGLRSIGVEVHSRRAGRCNQYWLKQKPQPRQWKQ